MAKLPVTSVNTSTELASTAGSTTGSITRSLDAAGEVPRLCAASSSCTSNPRMAASVPM